MDFSFLHNTKKQALVAFSFGFFTQKRLNFNWKCNDNLN